MTLTILAENTPHPSNPELISNHGFSMLIQTDEEHILYDFGPGNGTLTENARTLGVRLSGVTTAVLSHGHYDHSGDMAAFLKLNSIATVYHGRGAFFPRWSISKGPARDIGVPIIPTDEIVNRLCVVDTLKEMEELIILPAAPGHWPRPAGNANLLCGDEGARLPDEFTDELSLILKAGNGIILISGCSHRGILNIVDQTKTYCPKCPILAIIGGFHLTDSETEETLRLIAKELADKLPETRIITGHCTGAKAKKILSEHLGDSLEILHVGKVFTF